MALLRFTSSITLALAQIVSAPSSPTPAGVPSASVATPASPEERMALAQKVNGLHGLKQAWHLKATYEWFDPDGLTREKGAYEEWRVDEEHYRIAIHGPLTSTEEYGDERGIFRSMANVWLRSPLSRIHSLVVAPLQLPPGLGHRVVKNHERDFGAGKKPCTLIVDERVSYGQPGGIDYCFTPENAVLQGRRQAAFPGVVRTFHACAGPFRSPGYAIVCGRKSMAEDPHRPGAVPYFRGHFRYAPARRHTTRRALYGNRIGRNTGEWPHTGTQNP